MGMRPAFRSMRQSFTRRIEICLELQISCRLVAFRAKLGWLSGVFVSSRELCRTRWVFRDGARGILAQVSSSTLQHRCSRFCFSARRLPTACTSSSPRLVGFSPKVRWCRRPSPHPLGWCLFELRNRWKYNRRFLISKGNYLSISLYFDHTLQCFHP